MAIQADSEEIDEVHDDEPVRKTTMVEHSEIPVHHVNEFFVDDVEISSEGADSF